MVDIVYFRDYRHLHNKFLKNLNPQSNNMYVDNSLKIPGHAIHKQGG